MKKFQGINLREVWDYRLSNAAPLIRNTGEYWIVEIWAKINPDYDPQKPNTEAKPIESYTTLIECKQGNETIGIVACYEWLYSRRDQYSRDDIDDLKPIVSEWNRLNDLLIEKMTVEA